MKLFKNYQLIQKNLYLVYYFQFKNNHALDQGSINFNRIPEQKRRNSRANRVDLLIEIQRQRRCFQGLICSSKSYQPECSCDCTQLLTSLQRIPAIFLLIQNYKTQGINHHPFGATIFELVQNTPQWFEKKMISDMIIDGNRQQYSKVTVQKLYQRQQMIVEPIEDRLQILHLKQQFLLKLPNISQQAQSEVKNVVRDFIDKDKQMQIPQYHVNLSTIKQSQVSSEAYNIGFMRPIPKFIQIDHSEFHWFSPSLYSQVTWDTTSQTQKKLSKAKTLLKKALDQHLTKDQCSQIQKALQSQNSAVLFMQLTPEMINPLIKSNPFLAVAFLVKLSNYPLFQSYLDTLYSCQVNINSIDVVSRLIKTVKTPSEFSTKYTISILSKVLQMQEANKDRLKLARIIINFIKNIKKNIVITEQFQQKLDKFLDEFITVEEVQQYRKLMNKE